MKKLTLLEQMVLAAIIALKTDAYGVTIRKRVERLTSKRLMYGTLYNALDQLLRKGFVSRTKGKTISSRGGRPRLYYTLTPLGEEALRESFHLQQLIRTSIADFIGD